MVAVRVAGDDAGGSGPWHGGGRGRGGCPARRDMRRRRHRDGVPRRTVGHWTCPLRSFRSAAATCSPAISGFRSGSTTSLAAAVNGVDRRIDLGLVDDQPFAVMAGMGFDAAMMADTTEGMKRFAGWPAYVVSALRHLRDPMMRVRLRIDGGPPLRRSARTVLVGNVGQLEGGLELLPAAAADDGILDVVIVAPRTLRDWLRVALPDRAQAAHAAIVIWNAFGDKRSRSRPIVRCLARWTARSSPTAVASTYAWRRALSSCGCRSRRRRPHDP